MKQTRILVYALSILTDICEWLDKKVPEKWIGRRGLIDWPARSPDLTPTGFFLWGHVKEMVYKNKPQETLAGTEWTRTLCNI